MENLFRRQFVMGNISGENLPKNFIKEEISDNLNLFFHKDLKLKRIDDDGKSLILLGFLIDPYDYN